MYIFYEHSMYVSRISVSGYGTGGLTVPFSQMEEVVCACLAILDYTDKFIARHNESTIREPTERILETYSAKYVFISEQHTEKGLKFSVKIVINIFYNKQNLVSDEVRKHTVRYF